jgi:hypothetical protein
MAVSPAGAGDTAIFGRFAYKPFTRVQRGRRLKASEDDGCGCPKRGRASSKTKQDRLNENLTGWLWQPVPYTAGLRINHLPEFNGDGA